MGDSVPPASITSASPSAMSCAAYPIASMPDVQPVEMTVAGPCAPNLIATSVATADGTNTEYMNGIAYRPSTSQVRPPSLTATYSLSIRIVAPTALPRATPASEPSDVDSPASATDSAPAASANWPSRSIRRTSYADSPAFTGSKSHSAATWDRNPVGSKRVTLRGAGTPLRMRSQNASRVTPPGATTPMPVTTTRRAPIVNSGSPRVQPLRCRRDPGPAAAPTN